MAPDKGVERAKEQIQGRALDRAGQEQVGAGEGQGSAEKKPRQGKKEVTRVVCGGKAKAVRQGQRV